VTHHHPGVSVLSSVLAPAVLLHYPRLQLGYFSMLAYVLSSSPEFILPGRGEDSSQQQQISSAIGALYIQGVEWFVVS
jgi:hypothetical protein